MASCGKSAIPVAEKAYSRLKLFVDYLDLGDKVIQFFEDEEKVTVKTGPNRTEVLDVGALTQKWNITDKESSLKFISDARFTIRECTEIVLDSGVSNFADQLEMRANCLEGKGYNQNEQILFKATGVLPHDI